MKKLFFISCFGIVSSLQACFLLVGDFSKLPRKTQRFYLMGLHDHQQIQLDHLPQKNKAVKRLISCLKERNSYDNLEIMQRFITAHPRYKGHAISRYCTSDIYEIAFFEACMQ